MCASPGHGGAQIRIIEVVTTTTATPREGLGSSGSPEVECKTFFGLLFLSSVP